MIDRRGLVTGSVAAAAATAVPAMAAAQAPANEDWAQLGRYREDNARVTSGTRPLTVFIGDSITEGWRSARPAFFGATRVGRGIGGQTTPQMLVRFMPDVVRLRPRLVHIMAGTNDIAGNTGPISRQQSFDNLEAMAAIARAHGIGVIFGSVPPADGFPWRPGLATVAPIREINRWLARHAQAVGATFVDYTAALGTMTGAMRADLAYDGVHPTPAGYDAMIAVLEPVLARLERR